MDVETTAKGPGPLPRWVCWVVLSRRVSARSWRWRIGCGEWRSAFEAIATIHRRLRQPWRDSCQRRCGPPYDDAAGAPSCAGRIGSVILTAITEGQGLSG